MNTSEYAETKTERRGAKKVTRHPLFQKMRERALSAEAETNSVRTQLKKTQREASKVVKLEEESTRLKAELEEALAPKKAADPEASDGNES